MSAAAIPGDSPPTVHRVPSLYMHFSSYLAKDILEQRLQVGEPVIGFPQEGPDGQGKRQKHTDLGITWSSRNRESY